MIRTLLSAAALAALTALPASAEMMAHDAYARSANGKTGAAFMEIMNKGAADDVLVAARADVSRKVELHTHIFEGGVAKMREVEGGIPVPAGETVKLKRGGLHVMFMGLKAPMNSGESFPLTLVFQSGEEVQVDVTVDNERKPEHGMMHGKMKMSQ
ncbi:copper chaperone PCu(A)C [Rhodovulum sp. DZ06]|uniref:copper chaperone PCu(A)C n=1 Tax=Rhodovulum sp. DZ06 TaxID=3425126 RepID=UPI003D33FEB6